MVTVHVPIHPTAFDDPGLVWRAVMNATKNPRAANHPRWVYMRDAFAVGSTVAKDICRRFGLDPDEDIPGRTENDE